MLIFTLLSTSVAAATNPFMLRWNAFTGKQDWYHTANWTGSNILADNITLIHVCNATNCYTVAQLLNQSAGGISAVNLSFDGYIINNNSLKFNESKLNNTIDSRLGTSLNLSFDGWILNNQSLEFNETRLNLNLTSIWNKLLALITNNATLDARELADNTTQSAEISTKRNLSDDIPWENLTNYPAACPGNSYLTELDDTVTCTTVDGAAHKHAAENITAGTFEGNAYRYQGPINMEGNNIGNATEVWVGTQDSEYDSGLVMQWAGVDDYGRLAAFNSIGGINWKDLYILGLNIILNSNDGGQVISLDDFNMSNEDIIDVNSIDVNNNITIAGYTFFGNATGMFLKNGSSTQNLFSSGVPKGVITMWSGAIVDIPNCWKLADGTLGTTNLTDQFVVGAGNEYTVGERGGNNTINLTEAEMPRHMHDVIDGTGVDIRLHNANAAGGSFAAFYAGAGNDVITTYTGGNMDHENRPPYYALAYIQKTCDIIAQNITVLGVPIGGVMAFESETCPVGWEAADGTNGHPDLRGIFIRGAGQNSITEHDNGTQPGPGPEATYGKYQNGTRFNDFFPNGASTNMYMPNDDEAAFYDRRYNDAGTNDYFTRNGQHGNLGYSSIEGRPPNYALTYCVRVSADTDASNSFFKQHNGKNITVADSDSVLEEGVKVLIDYYEGDGTNNRVIDLGDNYNEITINLYENAGDAGHLASAYAVNGYYGVEWEYLVGNWQRSYTMAQANAWWQGKMTTSDNLTKIKLGTDGSQIFGANYNGYTYAILAKKYGKVNTLP